MHYSVAHAPHYRALEGWLGRLLCACYHGLRKNLITGPVIPQGLNLGLNWIGIEAKERVDCLYAK